jgi:hypothetical protein
VLQVRAGLLVITSSLSTKFQAFNCFTWTLRLIGDRKFFKLFFFKEAIAVAFIFLFFDQRPRRVKRLKRAFRLTWLSNNL